MSVRHQRTEAQIAHACDRAVERAGGHVARFMPGRVDGQQTPGVPRRRYYLDAHVLWWSPRSSKARLSAPLRDFLLREHASGQLVGAGDDRDLSRCLNALRTLPLDVARGVLWSFAVSVAGRDVRTAGETTCSTRPQ